MKSGLNDLFSKQRDVHILYFYDKHEYYLDKLVDYIQTGVSSGEHVILIENQRIYRMIKQRLYPSLSDEEIKLICWVNNFDFYFSSGSYHPLAIFNYFSKIVQTLVEDKLPFRSWAHVEWATMKGPLHAIEELERIVDEAIAHLAFPLICAYEGDQMPDYLRTILLETHPYILLQDEVITSEQYYTPIKN